MTAKYFSLEAMDAAHGDCLLLHYGTEAAPSHLLIDGGPTGNFAASLKPRLNALREKRNLETLRLAHTLVTHLDSDHIAGVTDLAKAIDAGGSGFACKSFWFNSFEEGLKLMPPELAHAIASLGSDDDEIIGSAVEHASIREGQELRNLMNPLTAQVNGGAAFLMAPAGGLALKLDDALDVTLLCPSQVSMQKLAKKWIAEAKPTIAETSAYVDKSVFNLSSLVMVVSPKGPGPTPRILLTGDARGDHILAGLASAGLLNEQGEATFDVLKVPHHGSKNNLELEFFQKVHARHYVISANGRDENPDQDVLEWLAQTAAPDAQIWITNKTHDHYPSLQQNIAGAIQKHASLEKKLRFRGVGKNYFTINLCDPVPW